MTTRNLADAHPELARRFQLAVDAHVADYGPDPQIKPICVYRSREEQHDLYAKGRTAPGPIVTYARAGQSLHNYLPAFAIDYGFFSGGAYWGDSRYDSYYRRFGAMLAKFGLQCGFTWGDLGHIQPIGFTWQQAAAGVQPWFPALEVQSV